ncbi:MAG: Gfo/Idh/MocA family oxidoreductase [Trueperaceae bacterium]|nr:MAG: Gfo/Idh/MocA family oxidoreductase [Trueperaceae bacterium]
MSALRTLLVGLGARGAFWAEVINRSPDCELVGYVDPRPEALQQARERFGDRPAFADVDEALAAIEGVEALVLATPPEGREQQIRAACERKLPLLVEKPLALSLEEAAVTVRQAEEADIPLMVGLNFRYLAVTEETVWLLREGVVGRPEFARFTYERWRDGYRARLNKYPLSMVHPMLWEQSIHHFDLMRFVYGAEPETAYCKTWNPSWTMYADDTNVSAIFTFTGDLVVNYQGTWQSGWQEPHFEWRTDCTEGILTQGDQFGELSFARRHDPSLTPVSLSPHEQWITDTSGVLRAFVKSVVGGEPLECSGRDHLKSLAMVEACITSSETGRAVDVRAILERLTG